MALIPSKVVRGEANFGGWVVAIQAEAEEENSSKTR